MDDGLMTEADLQDLAKRIGAAHVERRLKTETGHEAQLFGQGTLIFNLENWYSAPTIIEIALKLTGLYGRARQNADRILIRQNALASAALPEIFDGFIVLHISDLHADISTGAMRHLFGIVDDLRYDLCVLTGDYRGKTYGPFDKSLEYLGELVGRLTTPVYAVLGNHDTIRMAPGMEAMGIRVLFNESVAIERRGQAIYVAGVDDAHFYRADDISKAAVQIPREAFSILLSHTPELYRQGASAGFDLMLSGHTHGGQLCLPGGFPIKLEAKLPRAMGAGAWRYGKMAGYTSVGAGTSLLPVRLNCPPEITLHTLRHDPLRNER
jgi:hypothetical protein